MDGEHQGYPPPPWRMGGVAWTALFRTSTPVPAPASVARLSDALMVLVLVRYLEGTLTYDELILGTPVRRGLRIGLLVDRIWVDDRESMRGGRAIWSLPKQMARFEWSGEEVALADEEGAIARLRLGASGFRLPWLWLPASAFGAAEDRLRYMVARGSARAALTRVEVVEWTTRISYAPGERSLVALSLAPFRAEFPAARRLTGEA